MLLSREIFFMSTVLETRSKTLARTLPFPMMVLISRLSTALENPKSISSIASLSKPKFQGGPFLVSGGFNRGVRCTDPLALSRNNDLMFISLLGSEISKLSNFIRDASCDIWTPLMESFIWKRIFESAPFLMKISHLAGGFSKGTASFFLPD